MKIKLMLCFLLFVFMAFAPDIGHLREKCITMGESAKVLGSSGDCIIIKEDVNSNGGYKDKIWII